MKVTRVKNKKLRNAKVKMWIKWWWDEIKRIPGSSSSCNLTAVDVKVASKFPVSSIKINNNVIKIEHSPQWEK